MTDWFSGVTYTFAPATTISSSEMNQNFQDVEDAINEAAPTGIVSMWSGSIASIPSGWALCNGSGGTIDLRDKFIVCAGSSYSVADTGGAVEVTLTGAESGVAVHGHSLSYGTQVVGWVGSGGNIDYNSGSTMRSGVSIQAASAANASEGHENRPPYYALAFIQKIV